MRGTKIPRDELARLFGKPLKSLIRQAIRRPSWPTPKIEAKSKGLRKKFLVLQAPASEKERAHGANGNSARSARRSAERSISHIDGNRARQRHRAGGPSADRVRPR